jgi:hypothetical protein
MTWLSYVIFSCVADSFIKIRTNKMLLSFFAARSQAQNMENDIDCKILEAS